MRIPLFVCLIVGLLFPSLAHAQPAWEQPPTDRSYLSLDVIRPEVTGNAYADGVQLGTDTQLDDTSLSGASTAYFLSGQVRLSNRWSFAADLPIAYGQTNVGYGLSDGGPTWEVGNPYLGAGYHLNDRWAIHTGLRAPVGSLSGTEFGNPAVRAGSGAGFVERYGAFQDAWTMQSTGLATWTVSDRLTLRTHAGVQASIPTEASASVELAPLVGVQGWYETDRLALGLRTTGRLLDYDFRTEASVVGKFGRFRPGLHVQYDASPGSSRPSTTSIGLSLGFEF